jgi:hypothetical protein
MVAMHRLFSFPSQRMAKIMVGEQLLESQSQILGIVWLNQQSSARLFD